GSFVRQRAIFIQTGRHSRRTAQCHEKPLAIRSRVNSTGPLACLKSRDDRVRRAINHGDIARAFVADINEITWQLSAYYDRACGKHEEWNYTTAKSHFATKSRSFQ